MDKRSSKIIRRSLLPLASLTLGGCGVLGGMGYFHGATPPASEDSQTTAATTPPQGDMTPDAQKSILAFADRLAKADAETVKEHPSPVVLASDQHPESNPVVVATPNVVVTVHPTTPEAPPAPDKAIVPADPPAQVPVAPPSIAIASAVTDPHDVVPAVSAMGAMNATNTPALASLNVSNTPMLGDANTPTISAEPSIDSVLDLLRHRVQARPQQLNYALALALLESAEMRKTDDPALATLTPSDQKLVTDLNSAIEAISAQPTTPTTALSDRAAPLLAASERWQADGDLKLPRLALATRVDSFGVYTPVDPRFEYGKRQTVIIYCEVANFTAKRNDDSWYQTLLTQQDTLTTDDGLLVWRPNPEDVEDRSMNQRRDFYLVKKLTLPENLAIGKYTLKMSVTDKLAKKRAEVTMPIEIVGKQ